MPTTIDSIDDFNKIISERGTFTNFQFVRLTLDQKYLDDKLFEDCKFTSVIFKNSTLHDCFFINCDFSNCRFENVNIIDTNFWSADHQKYFKMEKVVFIGSEFNRVHFSGMWVHDITFNSIQMDKKTVFFDVFQSELLSLKDQDSAQNKYIKIPLGEIFYEIIESNHCLLLSCLQSALQKVPTQSLSPITFINADLWEKIYDDFLEALKLQIAETPCSVALLTLVESIRQFFVVEDEIPEENNLESSSENEFSEIEDGEIAVEDETENEIEEETEVETEKDEVYFSGFDPNHLNAAFKLSIEWLKSYRDYYQTLNNQFFLSNFPKKEIQEVLLILKTFYHKFQHCIAVEDDTLHFKNENSIDKKRKPLEDFDNQHNKKFMMIS